MTTDNDRDPLSIRVRELLDETIDHMDSANLSRLKQARSRALDRTSQGRSWQHWLPAGAVTAGLLAFTVYFDNFNSSEPALYQGQAQMEVVENMELLNDLEFVAWLALNENN